MPLPIPRRHKKKYNYPNKLKKYFEVKHLDRDLNASINILKVGASTFGVGGVTPSLKAIIVDTRTPRL